MAAVTRGVDERCERSGSIRTGPPSDQTVVPRKCLPDGRPIAAAERGAPGSGSSADAPSSRRRLAADAAHTRRTCRRCDLLHPRAPARLHGPVHRARPRGARLDDGDRAAAARHRPGARETSLAGPEGGLLLWIAFGLIGSLRVLPIPGSAAVWTFHFPFIAAAMVLGGPTAGAWVAFLATLERRELESQPWYGTLANHSVMAFGAVLGGLTVLVVRGALASASVDPGAAGVIAIAAGTLVLAISANAMAAGTIMLRERLAAKALLDILVRSFGRVTLAEIGLASVFAVAYVAVGWWAPAALAGVVLLVWPADGFDGIDPMMQLPRTRQFHRELDAVLDRSRRGTAPGGLLLMLDLVGFGQINRDVGHDSADEVLEEIGRRLRALVRRTDLIGRIGGDEIAIFFTGIVSRATADDLARRIESTVSRPVATVNGDVRVGVSIGAIIARISITRPANPGRAHALGRPRDADPEASPEGRTGALRGPVPPIRPDRTTIRRRDRRPGAVRGGAAAPDDGGSCRRLMGVSARWACRHARRPGAGPRRTGPGSNGAMSTDDAAPSRISSAIPSPIAGDVLKPVPLWPQSR